MSVVDKVEDDWRRQIVGDGFVVISRVFNGPEVAQLIGELELVLNRRMDATGPIRDRAGTVYAGRNLLELFPPTRTIWCRSPLLELLREILGSEVGLVRALFFDKPPERTWALPWHKDMTLAVKAHEGMNTAFSKPTLKAGIPHVEGSQEVLDAMLTLRIHLDDVTDENGPLQVLPGSHRSGKTPVAPDDSVQTILVQRGDVLAIRPLVAHRSISSLPETVMHRRILHLEFSGQPNLPDGFEWHDFIPPS